MKKFQDLLSAKVIYALISLVFTLMLFTYVSTEVGMSTNGQSPDVKRTALMSNESVTVELPLKVNIDDDKYFVVGCPETVKVKLTGPRALVTAAENTRNFDVYVNLAELKLGTHTVALKTSGLNKEITAAIEPEKIKVKISKKAIATLPVQVRFDPGQIAKSYAAGNASASRQVVTVIGSKADIAKIESVVADVELASGTKTTVTKSVLLQAIDKNGKVLDTVISPETVRVTVPIYQATTSKRVNINLVSSGTGLNNKRYSFYSDTKSVIVYGTKDSLSKLTTLDVPVSITGVNESLTRTIQITPTLAGITSVAPDTIMVKITVTDAAQSSSAESTVENNQTQDNENKDQSATSSSNSSQISSSSSSATNKN